MVNDHPIRTSRASALWCAESVRILWKNRRHYIAEAERDDARAAYERAVAQYLALARESSIGDSLVVHDLRLAE
jgi:hypothetical protein